MSVPIWAGHYIGLPFKEHGRDRQGVDCWGLVRLVLSEQYGFYLPSYTGQYDRISDAARIGQLVAQAVPDWRKISAGQEELGDVAVMRMCGQLMHVGVVIGDGQMLHVDRGVNSAIERYQGARWASRVDAFYRYRTYLDDLEYADDVTHD